LQKCAIPFYSRRVDYGPCAAGLQACIWFDEWNAIVAELYRAWLDSKDW
jgi:hypothetical protein